MARETKSFSQKAQARAFSQAKWSFAIESVPLLPFRTPTVPYHFPLFLTHTLGGFMSLLALARIACMGVWVHLMLGWIAV